MAEHVTQKNDRVGCILTLQKWPMRKIISILTVVIAISQPFLVYAEPRPSTRHIPFLWIGVGIGAIFIATIPFIIKKFSKSRCPTWKFWLISIVLGLLFLIFLGPIIVGLGSIVITGRTM